MEIKCLELRDKNTFIPVICIRPVAENAAQGYLLRRDGYVADATERCIIMIDAQCRGVSYDPYDWLPDTRTKRKAHLYIEEHWHELSDGEVIDVQFITGETPEPKASESVESVLEQGRAIMTQGDIDEITRLRAINSAMAEALDFIASLASEEYEYCQIGTGAEVALRHIIRKARAAIAKTTGGPL